MFVNNIRDVCNIYLQLAHFNYFECSFCEVQLESQGHSLTSPQLKEKYNCMTLSL